MEPFTLALGLAQFAPSLLRFFGAGEKPVAIAEKAIEIARTVTGAADGPAALAALQADPKLAQEYQLAVLKADGDLEAMYLADRQDARARDVALHQAGYRNTRADWMVVLDAIGLIACRALVWPFLYKAYGIGDFAEFLETYGLPIVMGKYYNGASPEERASLMRAVTALGHDARAIMPADMSIEIAKVAADGSGTPHLAMVAWAEGAQSKAILGQVLSAEAKATGMGSGVADLHAEVRHDIRNADARQIAGTITRDLIYPLLALNRGGIDSLARCPRLVFDTGEAEDITAYAEALPKLVGAGLSTIPIAWVHEKLRIPEPTEGEATLTQAAPAPADTKNPATPESDAAAHAALSAATIASADPTRATALAERLATDAAPAIEALLARLRELVAQAPSLPMLQEALLAEFSDLPSQELAKVMALAFAVADLAGRSDVSRGQ